MRLALIGSIGGALCVVVFVITILLLTWGSSGSPAANNENQIVHHKPEDQTAQNNKPDQPITQGNNDGNQEANQNQSNNPGGTNQNIKPTPANSKPIPPDIQPEEPDAKPKPPVTKPIKPDIQPEEPDAKPKPPVTKPIKPDIQPEEPDAKPKPTVNNNGALAFEVLKKVKDATVYLHVKLPGGRTAQGSGFFGHTPGLIFTNAHVLGIVAEWDTKPLSIEAVYHSGEPDERTYQARIVSVDRDADLAVLRVLGKNAPPPLTIKKASNIHETHRVYVVGFPFGKELGKNITVSQSSVSSLRKDSLGQLSQIQVNGGMHPGNSGGPVIDTKGDVIGVAVAVIEGTQINFAIPGDVVHSVIDGRVGSVQMLGRQFGTGVEMNVQVELVDPLKKIKSLSIDIWRGKPGEPRAQTNEPPAPMPGDSERKTIVLDPKKETITGKTTLGKLAPGEVYWYQPVIVNGLGQKIWCKAEHKSANAVAVLPPVNVPNLQRKPAELVRKYDKKVRYLHLSSKATLDIRSSTGENLNIPINMVTIMLERPISYNAALGLAKVQLEYKKYTIGVPTKYITPEKNARMKNIVQNIGSLRANLVIDKKGVLVKNEVDSSRIPFAVREELEDLHSQIRDSLDSLAVPIPNRRVQPNETWTAVRKVMFSATDEGVLAALRLTYRYVGTRERDGAREAVIQIHGDVISRPGTKLDISGKATGLAFFDLSAGQLAEAKVDVDTKLLMTIGGLREQATVTLASSLKRNDNPPKSTTPPPQPQPGGQFVLNANGFLPRGKTKVHFVNLVAGVTYSIDAKSAAFDTILGVQSPAGQLLRKDDDGGQGLNSRIVFTAPQSGQYRILVSSFNSTGAGPYLLTVQR